MKILVTGGAGYIGSVLCEVLLDAGYEVTVLDNLMYGSASLFHLAHREGFEFVRGDARNHHILNPLIEKADVIIPLAALVGAPACEENPYYARVINYDHIVGVTALAGERLVIYPNTNSGYGATSEICTEDTPLNPISKYGLTKQRAEDCLMLNARYSTQVIVLRLATVFGCSPRMRLDLLVNDFTYRAYTDKYVLLYEPEFMRNYIHIRDVADCFLHCIRNSDKMVGKAYNVGLDSANISKGDLAEKIKEHLPDFDISYIGEGRDPDQRNYIVSNQRLREAGFEATRGLDQGIEELIKGFKMMGRGKYSNV